MTLLEQVKPPQGRAWCRACDGEGEVFFCLTNDPSERPRWRECQHCDGRGLEPLPEKEEDDGTAES